MNSVHPMIARRHHGPNREGLGAHDQSDEKCDGVFLNFHRRTWQKTLKVFIPGLHSMTVPEKSKHKSENLSITLDSPPVTPAGYLLLLRMSDTIQIAARMPFRVAGWSGNIFFGFNVLRGGTWRTARPPWLSRDRKNRKVANFFGHCYEKCQW